MRRASSSTNYIFAEYGGARFMLVTSPFQIKPILYETRRKLLAGKLDVPAVFLSSGKTVLVKCSRGAAPIFSNI